MSTAEIIVTEARAWIGTPYLHQASLKSVGCDCLGLLRGVWRGALGTEPELPPPYTPDWAEAGADTLLAAAHRYLVETDPHDVRGGDVLLFRWRYGLPAKHCAIATSYENMIHAHDGACVTEIAISPWWRRHLSHAFRFPGI
ncbi:NlpC/P60 family protein [Microvirga sp. 2MCAF38]|uniref:NlpC/P60 family protein n=1 Tax=Microvirga sp. 2MCAF38 TaxID=3232989 RepID=UPI003F98E801